MHGYVPTDSTDIASLVSSFQSKDEPEWWGVAVLWKAPFVCRFVFTLFV
jgi:hypothetical protein